MRERRRMRMNARLLDVQRAKRTGAREALERARRHEEAARDEESQALAEAEAAQEQWLAFVSSPGFSPEYSRALVERLIDGDARAAEAAARAFVAADLRAGRQRDWQHLETEVRASERALHRLTRKVGRRDEEKKLAELADRTTFSRRRP